LKQVQATKPGRCNDGSAITGTPVKWAVLGRLVRARHGS
jgi:hypothetical protein